jgi:rhodanese-related sulfurtransferase
MRNSIFLIFIFLLGSCSAQNFPSISAEDAYQKMQANDSVVFVDVRTAEEFNGSLGNIEKAVLIPLHLLESDYGKLESFKDREIIVYCRSGNRSRFATQFLREKGYDATNMLGGILDWNKIQPED